MLEQNILNVSPICLGTWVFAGDAWGGSKENDCMGAVSCALDRGINFIDTAPIYGYGRAEEIVGRAIQAKRDKVILATKCGLRWEGKKIRIDLSPASIKAEIDASLKRLNVDMIDLYQCHWPDPKNPIEKTMECLLKLKEQGKIKHIGVSNFDGKQLQAACDSAQIVTLQNQYSIVERSIEKEAVDSAVKNNVGILTYGSLGGGVLTGKYQQEPKFAKGDPRSFFYHFYRGEKFEQINAMLETLKSFGKPLNQIAINWLRQKSAVTSVIVGCRNAEQVEKNIGALDWELTSEQQQAIDVLN